ncbi:MAG: hypothetical protein AAFN30_04940 [Actinomycetota bacterium]
MVFLCGRPGCGRESSATLQIDAPSSTISLVDPRVSRDGVPLCPHHADATTPPMGWTMNDLRSQNRTLAPVPEIGPATGEIVNNPTGRRAKTGGTPLFDNTRPAERSTARKPRKADAPSTPSSTTTAGAAGGTDPSPADAAERAAAQESLRFPVSRDLDSMPVSAREERRRSDQADGGERDVRPAATTDGAGESTAGGRDDRDGVARSRRRRDLAAPSDGPDTRPSKRREVGDDEEAEAVEEEKFSWSFKFDEDDEQPEELQAKSPLLSRAFRSSVG